MPASLPRYIFSRKVANNFDLNTFPKKTKWTPPGFHIPPPHRWYRRCVGRATDTFLIIVCVLGCACEKIEVTV